MNNLASQANETNQQDDDDEGMQMSKQTRARVFRENR